MKTYSYNNHKTNESIEIEATDILEADKKYFKLTKINVNKAQYIGIQIIKK
jgi:hypothetical protein